MPDGLAAVPGVGWMPTTCELHGPCAPCPACGRATYCRECRACFGYVPPVKVADPVAAKMDRLIAKYGPDALVSDVAAAEAGAGEDFRFAGLIQLPSRKL